ncbi:hypothetical protein IL306_010186 [Fusarium sp. DS 682]|nr:hypothetical protein IL306_010186 [Fusarium sp. DS 682]
MFINLTLGLLTIDQKPKEPTNLSRIIIMPHPLLKIDEDQKASGPSGSTTHPPASSVRTVTSSIKKQNPIYHRSFLCWAIGAAATLSNENLTLRIMKHHPDLDTWTIFDSHLKTTGDIQVVCITTEEMKKMPERFGGEITNNTTTTRTGPSLAEFPGFGYPVPDFSMAKGQGLEVLAWRVYGGKDKTFMDTDGFALPGVSPVIQTWFERI